MWTRFLPATKALPKEMFPVIDKPVMQLLVEEAISAWCTDIIIVTWRSKRAIEDHFDSNFELEDRLDKSGKFEYLKTVKWLNSIANIVYVRQPYPRWDWEAIFRTKNLIWNEPFLVLFWDDIVDNDKSVASQLVDIYNEKKCSVISTVEVTDKEVSDYWIIETNEINSKEFLVDRFIEKPEASETSSRHWVIWKYILTPEIFDYLEKANPWKSDGEIRLADAFELMRQEKDIYWMSIEWIRYDAWSKLWFLKLLVAHALERDDLKDEFRKYLKGVGL